MSAELEKLFSPDVLTALDERARRVAESVLAEKRGSLRPSDAGAEEMRSKLAHILAKEFVSVPEAATLLSCSDGHVRNLVRKAKKGGARWPIPFRDLDGVVVFKLDKLLAWSEQPKERLAVTNKSCPLRPAAVDSSALLSGPRLPERSDVS